MSSEKNYSFPNGKRMGYPSIFLSFILSSWLLMAEGFQWNSVQIRHAIFQKKATNPYIFQKPLNFNFFGKVHQIYKAWRVLKPVWMLKKKVTQKIYCNFTHVTMKKNTKENTLEIKTWIYSLFLINFVLYLSTSDNSLYKHWLIHFAWKYNIGLKIVPFQILKYFSFNSFQNWLKFHIES